MAPVDVLEREGDPAAHALVDTADQAWGRRGGWQRGHHAELLPVELGRVRVRFGPDGLDERAAAVLERYPRRDSRREPARLRLGGEHARTEQPLEFRQHACW
jgi:hypothetical protein